MIAGEPVRKASQWRKKMCIELFKYEMSKISNDNILLWIKDHDFGLETTTNGEYWKWKRQKCT